MGLILLRRVRMSSFLLVARFCMQVPPSKKCHGKSGRISQQLYSISSPESEKLCRISTNQAWSGIFPEHGSLERTLTYAELGSFLSEQIRGKRRLGVQFWREISLVWGKYPQVVWKILEIAENWKYRSSCQGLLVAVFLNDEPVKSSQFVWVGNLKQALVAVGRCQMFTRVTILHQLRFQLKL